MRARTSIRYRGGISRQSGLQGRRLRRELAGFTGTIFSVSLTLTLDHKLPKLSDAIFHWSALGVAQLVMLLGAIVLPV
jgi:hypothetical protein